MLHLPLPTMSHAQVYELAQDRFTVGPSKQRLLSGQDTVLIRGTEYINHGTAGTLHSIAADSSVPPCIRAGDMQKLYNRGLLRKKSEARTCYEKLRLSSPFSLCPMCLHRTTKTLDHYLPKDRFGAYAVLPANLIPCCRDCSSEKNEFVGVDRAASLLHPYFDDVDSTLWPGCELEKLSGFCKPTFFIAASVVNSELLQRLTSHMVTLDLFELYDIKGARELNDMTGALTEIFTHAGCAGVQELCDSISKSREVLAKSHWRAALWRTAARDADFCSLGWKNTKQCNS